MPEDGHIASCWYRPVKYRSRPYLQQLTRIDWMRIITEYRRELLTNTFVFETEKSMRIEEADLTTLKTAQRRGRVRSPDTQALIESIDPLVPGAAKAVVVESGQTPQKVRARVMYAGKASGKKLQAAISGNRVLFALREERRRPGRPRKNPA